MTVVHVINSMSIGGAEVLLANSLTANALPKHVKNILVYFQGDSSLLNRVDPSVEVICLDYKNKLHLPKALFRLRKILTSRSVDIVHTHLNPAGFYTSMICPRSVKQVHTMHTIYSMDTDTRGILKYLERETLLKNRGGNLIFLSKRLEEDFKTLIKFRGHSYILPNFINECFFSKSNRDICPGSKFKIVSVGLKEAKNHEFSVEVFKHLRGKGVNLDIYGDENLEFYHQIIDKAGVPIKLKGKAENLHELLKSYDLFFMPSKYEGYPLSVLEAMAAGLPLLLSDIMPLRDIGKEYAFYFNLDDPIAVAEYIMQLKSNPALLNEKAKAGKEYSAKVGLQKTYVESLLGIYKDILSRNN